MVADSAEPTLKRTRSRDCDRPSGTCVGLDQEPEYSTHSPAVGAKLATLLASLKTDQFGTSTL